MLCNCVILCNFNENTVISKIVSYLISICSQISLVLVFFSWNNLHCKHTSNFSLRINLVNKCKNVCCVYGTAQFEIYTCTSVHVPTHLQNVNLKICHAHTHSCMQFWCVHDCQCIYVTHKSCMSQAHIWFAKLQLQKICMYRPWNTTFLKVASS